ncbi:MAG: WXG100 family type VII secretion target [Micrococcales bacterium]|nr:WXG100 family type VII secretion target [Micrococcales bacterium]
MGINVSYEEMNTAATRLTTGQEEITTTLNSLKGYIDGLVSNGFVTDQASVAFGESYQEFTNGATTAIEGLTGMADYLTQAAQALADTDAALATGTPS